jgi:hypothetical protein
MSRFEFEGVSLVTDFSALDWIREALREAPPGDPPQVGNYVPAGFPAYARVLHPGRSWDGSELRLVSWAEIASSTGHEVHADMQFRVISSPNKPGGQDWSGEPPVGGDLPRSVGSALLAILPSAEWCWMCLWDGWGALELEPYYPIRFRLPNRSYLVYKGMLDRAVALGYDDWEQSAALWWPDDRAWIVVTEIDSYCTYVGGSRDLINRVLASDDLEAWPTTLDSTMDANGYWPRDQRSP